MDDIPLEDIPGVPHLATLKESIYVCHVIIIVLISHNCTTFNYQYIHILLAT